jgi:hypothetical protein
VRTLRDMEPPRARPGATSAEERPSVSVGEETPHPDSHGTAIALAHDLNQPLTALLLYLQAARTICERAGTALPPDASALIDKAMHEGERAADVVHRMRERAAAAAAPGETHPLAGLLDEACALAHALTPGGVEVVRAPAPSVSLCVDYAQTRQRLVALMLDAAIARGTYVRRMQMDVKVEGDQVAVTVAPAEETADETAANGQADAARAGGESASGALFTLRLPMA